jgi:hypothetical protein
MARRIGRVETKYRILYCAVQQLLDALQPLIGDDVVWNDEEDEKRIPLMLSRMGIENEEPYDEEQEVE